jgi:hypothetical protein
MARNSTESAGDEDASSSSEEEEEEGRFHAPPLDVLV